jgi:23S rRNA (pseudouridine1915-N3)-methyltransferase
MNITILAVGKLKERYLVEGIKEYSKRLSKYTKLNIIEVQDEKAPDHLNENDIIQVLFKEGEKLLKKFPKDSYNIALTLDGNTYTSEEFASKIEQIKLYHNSHITFIIGGSHGLSKHVLTQVDETLSFSKFTFPHQLMRLILLEQIYRSFRINNNEPYHK